MKAIEARPSSSLCLFIARPSSSLSLHYFTLSFSFLNQKAVMDSPNPFTQSSGFLDLLTSQQCDPVSQNVAFGSSEVPFLSSQFTNDPTEAEETTEDRRGRKKWSRKEDVVLISAWLNTSKDPVTGNEQKAGSFWKRIGAYFNASPQLVGMADREVGNCKQRWSKISDQVSKFVGSLRAATSQQSSGQNDNDVMKLANEIYHHDYRAKFTVPQTISMFLTSHRFLMIYYKVELQK
ncbi:hypothetical protein YC2023_073866 [Brassica napus]